MRRTSGLTDWLIRHGSDSTTILLAKFGFWRLSTIGHKIGMDGSGMHAFCLVGRPDDPDDPANIPPNTDSFYSATASKTNWITLVTGVSHEKLQVFHRWISYAFFLLALMHTFPFIVFHIRFGDMV